MSGPRKGARLTGKGPNVLLPHLVRSLEEKGFDAVLIPLCTPGQDSFAYVLVKDPGLLSIADPVPPVQTTTGGKALSNLTKHGGGRLRIAAVMRPCEARGTVELAKLGQVDLTNVTMITLDCPGTIPLQTYFRGGERPVRSGFLSNGIRPICQMCDRSFAPVGDLHLGWCVEDEAPVLMFTSQKGEQALEALRLTPDADISNWAVASKELSEAKGKERARGLGEMTQRTAGLNNLMEVLGPCIDCHNCMRVCPVCYCRVCTFDLKRQGHTPEDVLELVKVRGRLRLPLDTLMFHLGRMNHMSLNCVSCGACEDACPAGIPIAQIFAAVADRTQKAFGYQAGLDLGQRPPLITFLEEELEGDHVQGH
ncbi:MAG: (Fe-S)-binding protein [Methanomassiliicoccales archaeon]|nr:(Fe-S)-binding protein [Methanomassiliicoccales archaeon]